jgi:DNA/RNA-binding domain of Phe-tRNA-synthetase-like protein
VGEGEGRTTTALVVHEDAVRLGVEHPVACLIRNVSVRPDGTDALRDEVGALMAVLEAHPAAICSRPEVRGFEELFARMGYPQQVPAGQRLIESLQRRGFRRYDDIVDASDIASAWTGSGLGMHDARRVLGDVHVYRASGREQIAPMFEGDRVEVVPGDLVYADRAPRAEGGAGPDRVIAWLGRRDVDPDEFKVREDTTSLPLVASGNDATSEDYHRASCLEALELIRRTCPGETADSLETRVGGG